jgi:hypothetical protein
MKKVKNMRTCASLVMLFGVFFIEVFLQIEKSPSLTCEMMNCESYFAKVTLYYGGFDEL